MLAKIISPLKSCIAMTNLSPLRYFSVVEDVENRKKWNFSAGPSIIPREVLKIAQKEFLNYRGTDSNILEISHRSKEYEEINNNAEKNLRKILNIPKNYKVLLMQGGATFQFSAIPMNLLKGKKTANYLVTGNWSQKSYEEARKYCKPHLVVPFNKKTKFVTIPNQEKWNVDKEGAYFYYCANETIHGVEFHYVPDVSEHNQILVCDSSSNFCSKPIDVSKFGLIYAGAQKNIGPSGITVVIVREDLIGKIWEKAPIMSDYKIFAENKSLYNTPPSFSVYIMNLYFEYLLKKGGVEYFEELNIKKSSLIYDLIDASDFYVNPVEKEFRSRMNIPFIIPKDKKLENKFIDEAKKAGLLELKGHKSVGGCRASIYNGMPLKGVEKLASFMEQFQNKYK